MRLLASTRLITTTNQKGVVMYKISWIDGEGNTKSLETEVLVDAIIMLGTVAINKTVKEFAYFYNDVRQNTFTRVINLFEKE